MGVYAGKVNADGSIIIDTRIDTKGFAAGSTNIQSQFTKLGNAARKVGAVIASVFAIREVVQFSKECLDLGSDLQEVQNVVDVTFTTMNEQVNEFAKNAAQTAGLSETMAKKYTGTFGAMAKSFKFTEAEAYEMSTALTQLSGDVASFYNLSQDEAYTKLKSVFTGETESLKDLGVVMTQTALDSYALAKGMEKTTSQMTEQEKVALRYQFVMDQLSAASGDFLRTSDSWANQTRLLTLQFDQLKATLGQGLINVLTPVVKLLNTLLTQLQGVANAFLSFTNSVFGNAGGSSSGGVADSYAAAAESAGDLAENTEEAGKAAKKALAGFDELNILQSGSDRTEADVSLGGLSTGAMTVPVTVDTSVQDNISPKIQGIIDEVMRLIEPLKNIDFEPLKKSFKKLIQPLRKFGKTVKAVFTWVWKNMLAPLAEWTVEDAAPASIGALSGAFNGLSSTIAVILSAFEKLWAALEPVNSFIEDTVILILKDLEQIGNDIAKVWEEKGSEVEQAFEDIGTVIGTVWTIIEPILTMLRHALSTLAKDIPITDLEHLIDILSGVASILAGIVTFDLSKVFSGLGTLVEGEVNYALNWTGTFAELFGIDFSNAKKWAEDAMDGIAQKCSEAWKKIEEWWSPVGEWFQNLFSSVKQTATDVFHNIGVIASGCWEIIKTIFSPLVKWFDEKIIQPVAGFFSGLWDGTSEGASNAWKEIKKIFSAVADFFKGILNGVITALNSVLSWIFGGINEILSGLKNFEIAGATPFSEIKTISVPQIPYLAQGAVLPPNKPFMAVLGDQHHGNNIEAPEGLIRSIFKEEMVDMVGGMMSGFEALLEENQRLRQVVELIEVGDTTIGQAANRYNQKMAIIKGGGA